MNHPIEVLSGKRSSPARGWRGWMAALLLALVACGQAPLPPLTLGMNAWVGYDPLVLARDRGQVDKRLVRVVELASGTEVQRALRNGLLDAAAITLDEAMRLAEAGLDLQVIALLDASHGADVVLARPAIADLSQLRGAAVAVEDSSVGALMLQRMLQKAGLARADIRPVNMDANHHLGALRSGQVDLAVSYAPLSAQLLAAGFRPVFTSREIPGEIVDVLVVRRELLATRPEAIDAMLRAWDQGLRALQADPAASVPALARGTELSPAAYAEVLQGLQFVPLQDSLQQLRGPTGTLQARARVVAAALREAGMLQREPALGGLIDTRPLERVLASEARP